MRIVAALRVKNEARWIERVIASIRPLCDSVLVLDDHSTDDTVERALHAGAAVFPSPFTGLDEARDKNALLEEAEHLDPDWILFLDGDEMLTPHAMRELPRLLETTTAPSLSLRIWYLWDREDQVRVDGVYGDFHRSSVFRPDGSRFQATGAGGNFHCGNVPETLHRQRQVSELAILHFGYLHREDRERKYRWYNERDPMNEREDRYRHMVIGDLFPSHSRFCYGGPLELRAL